MKIDHLITAFVVLLLSACSQESSQPVRTVVAADYLFTNGLVRTINDEQPEAEAVAVVGSRITFVGSADDGTAFVGADTHVIDLEGRVMLPGFVDSHSHLIASGWLDTDLSLYAATNRQETLKLVETYARSNPDLSVIVGIGWSAEVLGGPPSASDLDAIVPDRPVLLIEAFAHEGWMNTAAMRAARITRDTPDTQPGTTYWVRDENDNPTGLAYEFQWLDVYIALGLWDSEEMIPEINESLTSYAVTSGITTLLNPGILTPNILNPEAVLEDFRIAMNHLGRLEASGELRIRTFPSVVLKSEEASPVRFAEFSRAMADRYRSDLLAVKGIKIHPESGLANRGAPFLTPYEGTDHQGRFGVSPQRIYDMTMEANRRGLDTYIHVEGNATVRAAIDAFEAARNAGFGDARNTLHHLAFVHPDDVPRIIELGIGVNATPQFNTSMAGQDTSMISILGEKRVNEQLGLYSDLAHEGVRVTIAEDFPGTPLEMLGPLYNIQVATTLIDPSDPNSRPFPPTRKPMTLEQAVRAVTIDGAWFLHMEDKIGSIEVGKYADLVILEQDLFEVETDRIKDVSILATMMNGSFTHRDGI